TVQTVRAQDTLSVPPTGEAPLDALLAEMRYEPTGFEVRVVAPNANGFSHFASTDAPRLVRFDSSGDLDGLAKTVTLEWFPAKDADGRAPVVLVLHSIFPRMSIARAVARALGERGVHAFMMHAPGYGLRTMPGPRFGSDFFKRQTVAVGDARRARDAIAALPGVNAQRVSILGVSLGGFQATHAAGLDGAFEHAFLILAGADLHGVLTNGRRDAANVRRGLNNAGINGEALRDFCARFEPALTAARLDPQTTYLYSARRDSVVPPANARALGDAIGLNGGATDHHVWFDADHYTAGLHMPWVVGRVVRVVKGAE
ncbi:MAG: alpha/beta hydrolase family protein, partial [Planctomycetota bacterium]